jgi:hypothetical protein
MWLTRPAFWYLPNPRFTSVWTVLDPSWTQVWVEVFLRSSNPQRGTVRSP